VDRAEIVTWWEFRFGIPETAFEGYCFYRKRRNIWVVSKTELPKLRYETIGLRMISTKGKAWKPTTYALQLFGRHATKNVVELSHEQVEPFVAGESQLIDDDLENGYVIVSFIGDVIGCGLYARGKLVSQLPKERRIAEGEIENWPCGDN
jgi:NOL1/NOP2/fmu family ribosome biogenesis protein